MSRAKKLPSGNWRVNQYIGRDKDGKRRYKSFTAATKKAAEFMAASYLADESRKATVGITIGEAINKYISSKDSILSPTTLSNYRKIRKNHFQSLMDVNIDSVTREMIQTAVNEESKRVKPKTVWNAHGLLAATIKMYRPDFNLYTTLPRRVRQLKNDLPTSEEIVKCVKGTRVEIPVLLALCLCLRLSEVRGVRKSSIHGNNLLIDRVVVTVDRKHVEKELAKTDASRRVEVLPPFLTRLILSNDGEYATDMSGVAIYKAFKRIMSNAGYPNMRFHDLRHVAASDMHKLGISDRVAAERGGWSGTETMRRVYQHSFSEDRVKADENMISYYESIVAEVSEESTEDNDKKDIL